MKFSLQDDGLAIDIPRLPPIFVHPGIALSVAFVTYLFWLGSPATRIGASYLFAIGVVLSILAHELGHALTARRLGFRAVLIRLHAGGGQAMWEGRQTTWRELRLIVIAGPATNLAIAVVLLAGHALIEPSSVVPNPYQWAYTGSSLSSFWTWFYPLLDAVEWLGWINLFWAIINLLPAYPLDGGQLLTSFLEPRIGYYRTRFWIGLSGTILGTLSAILSVIGLLVGVLVWVPLPIAQNWAAVEEGRNAIRRSRSR